MAGVSVYLSNTTIGTVSSTEGAFTLNNVPPGNYKLTASFLGYKTQSVTVTDRDSSSIVHLRLHQDVRNLKEVTIQGKRRKDKNRKKYFELFRANFIGTDDNAMHCKILNRDVLYYGYDDKSSTFTAGATEPLIILNNALGYKIYYDLQSFSFNFKEHHIVFSGYPRFEKLNATSPEETENWKSNRIHTYLTSKRFFMLMLKNRQLQNKGFEVNKLIRANKDSLPPLPVYSSHQIDKMLYGHAPLPKFSEPRDTMYPKQEPYDSMIGEQTDSGYVKLKFSHSLRVLVPAPGTIMPIKKSGLTVLKFRNGSIMQSASPSPSRSSISIITMAKPAVYIDPNGVLTDPVAVSVEGAWARMHVADLLPFDYNPRE